MYKPGESSKRVNVEERSDPFKRPRRPGGEASSSTSAAGRQPNRAGYSGDTRVIMHNGDILAIRDLQAGDQLLGDDGTPRTVTRITAFEDTLEQVDVFGTNEPLRVTREQLQSKKKKSFTVLEGANERYYISDEEALAAAKVFADSVEDRSTISEKKYTDARRHRQFITPVAGGYVVYTAGEPRTECYIYDANVFNIPRDFRRRHNILVSFPTAHTQCIDNYDAFDRAQQKNDEIAIAKSAAAEGTPTNPTSRDIYVKVDPFYPGLYRVEKGRNRNEVFYLYEYTRGGRKVGARFHISDRVFFDTADQAEAAAIAYEQSLFNNGEVTLKGDINYMTLNQRQDLPASTRRLWLLFRTGVDFAEQELTVDPYYLGLWLGDGSRNRPTISNNHEQEVVNFLKRYAEKLSMRLVHYSNSLFYTIVRNGNNEQEVVNPVLTREQEEQLGQVQSSLENYNPETRVLTDLPPATRANGNKLLQALRDLQVTALPGVGPQADRKHVPLQYKMNSRMNRLLLTAGLIDSDGSYYPNEHRFAFSQAKRWHERLFNDMVWVSRSLGFNVYEYELLRTSTPPGRTVPHTAVQMFANVKGYIEEVPCLLQRKQPRLRLSTNDPLVSSIQNVGHETRNNQQCYNVHILGNNKRFLRFDFLVLHDSS